MKRHTILLFALFSVLWTCNIAFGAIIVGRIAHVEGQIYRYMDTDQSWVETFVESPAGTQDVLAAGADSRAEIVFPNNVTLRLDENAEIEILSLDEDGGSFVLHGGQARFYNRSSAGRLTVETARGLTRVAPGSIIDMRADGESFVVAAVLGEATFQSFNNDIENVEVISGSTSLEFREDRIVAGVGPIDRKWDRWCTDREGAWSRNRQVRSEYLPETMQDYASVLEPYGTWRRVYYRGYYYWAWKPRNVAVGWAPYTTGYWYDWQGGPVWIDQNPWGWVTHHHGHWVRMNRAWLWTPYVHVSHVPGVTTVGFSITFGRKYRSHWHPGRVRWIAHNSYVGWLPLAPWETYYGRRRWGTRSVVAREGVSFSINLNLSNHRYIDHAVIIPKHHFHQRGKPVVINNYNTVKIKNINKTVIVKNYKPVSTVDERRGRKHAAKISGVGKAEKHSGFNSGRKTTKTRERIRSEKHVRKVGALINTPKKEQEKRVAQKRRTVTNKPVFAKATDRTVENKRKRKSKIASQTESASSEGRDRVKKSEKRKNLSAQNNVIRAKSKKRTVVEETSRRRSKETRQAVVEFVSKPKVKQGGKTAALRRNSSGAKKQAQKQTHIAKRQAQRNEGHPEQSYHKNRRKFAANEKSEVRQREREVAGSQNYSTFQNTQKERQGGRKQADRAFISASLKNQRFR